MKSFNTWSMKIYNQLTLQPIAIWFAGFSTEEKYTQEFVSISWLLGERQ